MATSSQRAKRFPLISSLLLLLAYFSFGWFLSAPGFPTVDQALRLVFGSRMPVIGETVSVFLVPAVIWILFICSVFISPLDSFSRFITRWFKSDTVAFLSIFMLAGMAALVLFWLHIFLHILSILATESLARVEVQAAGFSNWQAFVILLLASLLGLALGGVAREYSPFLIERLDDLLPILAV